MMTSRTHKAHISIAKISQSLRYISLLIMVLFSSSVLQAKQPQSNWVSTWMASPQPVWNKDFAFPTKIPELLQDKTIRQISRISLGGDRLRIELSNQFGTAPIQIAQMTVAIPIEQNQIDKSTLKKVTFSQNSSISIAAGARVLSDPINLNIANLSKITTSIYVKQATPLQTFHWDGLQTAWIGQGDQTQNQSINASQTTTARLFLSKIMVEKSQPSQSILVIGDSITDGNNSTLDNNSRWPDLLANRLAAHNIAVVNAGISGGRLLSNVMGMNAITRMDDEILNQPNIGAVIVLIGINDIAWPDTIFDQNTELLTAQQMIAGYRQLIAKAHTHNVKIFAATLAPFQNALPNTPLSGKYYRTDKDQLRQQVNDWIRTSKEFDGVVDVDKITQDPHHPLQLDTSFDSGDHLHLSDLGNKKLANAIPLQLFK